MSRSPLVAFLMAIGLRAMLNVATTDGAGARARRRATGSATASATGRPEPPADPRRARVALGLFAVGAILMLVFESPVTRVLGVLALGGFVVSGVFALADPRWLGGAPALGQSGRHGASGTGGSG